MLGLNGKLLDFIYPVGSYYETSDTSFNPNTAWGGTWLEDTKGRVTVALDSDDTDFDTINETGGSKYLQSHYHTAGKYDNLGIAHASVVSGSGQTSLVASGSSATTHISTNTAGSGNSQNLQPYIVVKRWHRTA